MRLDDDDCDAIVARIELFEAHGSALGRPVVDTVEGSRHASMKELRAGTMRALFASTRCARRSSSSVATSATTGRAGTSATSCSPTICSTHTSRSWGLSHERPAEAHERDGVQAAPSARPQACRCDQAQCRDRCPIRGRRALDRPRLRRVHAGQAPRVAPSRARAGIRRDPHAAFGLLRSDDPAKQGDYQARHLVICGC